MVIAKIYVSGARATVYGLQKIPSGIVGAAIELSFGNDWDGLTKTAVFRGVVTKDVIITGNRITIPAECVAEPGHRLQVGFYGVRDETKVIPTIWADLGAILDAADPSGDTDTDPTLPIWAQILEMIENLNAGQGTSIPSRIAEIELLANGWVGEESPYSQVVNVPGVTMNSQVDLTPSVEQLTVFYDKDLAFVTENEEGVVTVYAVGQKPENDYTMQVTLKEVTV